MIPITDNYKFGKDLTIEDQIRRTNNWIYKTKKSNFGARGAADQRRWVSTVPGEYYQKIAVSIPPQAGLRFTWSKTWGDRQKLWKAVITGDSVRRLSIPIRGCS